MINITTSRAAEQKSLKGLIMNFTRSFPVSTHRIQRCSVPTTITHCFDARAPVPTSLHIGIIRAAATLRRQLTAAELSRQLLASKEQLRAAHHARRGDAHREEALAQLQSDNARLVKILATTEEYKEFVHYADDSGGLSYVPPPARQPLPSARAATRQYQR